LPECHVIFRIATYCIQAFSAQELVQERPSL
jgi:hypothetical protein